MGPISRRRLQYALRGLCCLGVEGLFAKHRRPSAGNQSRGSGDATNTRRPSLSPARRIKRATFSPAAAALHFSATGPSPASGVFYQVVEAGYDRTLPSKAITSGLEVYRELVDEKGTAVDRGHARPTDHGEIDGAQPNE